MFYIKNMFNNYFHTLSRWKDYKSRSGRKEFWSFNIVNFIINLLLSLLIQGIKFRLIVYCFLGIYVAYNLFVFIPKLSLFVRRLHDIGWCGVFLLYY